MKDLSSSARVVRFGWDTSLDSCSAGVAQSSDTTSSQPQLDSFRETHFQDLMRVILSIKAGTVLPSTLLRKLGTYSKKNRLYLAFQELGRVVRTVFLLQYISD
jgi:TnpA family transposase